MGTEQDVAQSSSRQFKCGPNVDHGHCEKQQQGSSWASQYSKLNTNDYDNFDLYHEGTTKFEFGSS